MIQEARNYLSHANIRRREPLYSANRFARLIGDISAEDITTDHLQQYRDTAAGIGLSARTVESSISDLITVIRHQTGRTVPAGRRLKSPSPDPQPVTFDALNAIWPHCDPWLQQWIAISYWTCLRLADVQRMQLQLSQLDTAGESLRWSSSKTRHRFTWPIPDWLRQHLQPVPLPFYAPNDFGQKLLRQVLTSICKTADVDRWTPKQLRQRAISEWCRADAMAGRLIHGTGIGVLRHYVDPLTVLEQHQHKVRLPACFGAGDTTATDLADQIRRLDPDAQQLIQATISRIA